MLPKSAKRSVSLSSIKSRNGISSFGGSEHGVADVDGMSGKQLGLAT
jgi:hypothetical protein